jgi:hypothetical protein
MQFQKYLRILNTRGGALLISESEDNKSPTNQFKISNCVF